MLTPASPCPRDVPESRSGLRTRSSGPPATTGQFLGQQKVQEDPTAAYLSTAGPGGRGAGARTASLSIPSERLCTGAERRVPDASRTVRRGHQRPAFTLSSARFSDLRGVFPKLNMRVRRSSSASQKLNSIGHRTHRAPLFGPLVRVSWSATADRPASLLSGTRRAR